jgi:hypothetical protein
VGIIVLQDAFKGIGTEGDEILVSLFLMEASCLWEANEQCKMLNDPHRCSERENTKT